MTELTYGDLLFVFVTIAAIAYVILLFNRGRNG